MPGQILHWDGTYDLAKKLINLPELDCEVLLLIFGEYRDILTFAFAESESPKNTKTK
jgi:hypothetical protein